MQMISRRSFVGAAAGVAAAGCEALRAAPLGMPIGCQTYPVRELLGKDFPGTLQQLASIGYRAIEMCSPPGYERSGFGSLVKLKAPELRKIIRDAGLRCESSHYQFRELNENLDERIAFAKELGLKQMVLSMFGLPKTATMDDWVRAADQLNKVGEKTQKAGIQTVFHNHNFEFQKIDGVLIYDKLMEAFNPKLVKMQFQVAVISIGYNAADYLAKYPGRFASLHLADWSATEKKAVPVGKGVVDWKKVFAAAKAGGVKNYFVEMDLESMKASVPYLQGLKA
jgi:sugar phosphate isomerase/epimerase